MRRLLVAALLAGGGSWGCSDARPPVHVTATTGATNAPPLAPLAAQRARLATLRLVPPDARFVAAVAALHHVVTGWSVMPPELEPTEAGTRIRYYGKEVGTLPDRASFADAVALLAAWAPKIGKPWALPETAPGARGDLLLDGDALATLAHVQGEWEKAPSRRGLHDAARALVGLALGGCDDFGLGDELSGRALAAVVLDRLQGTDADRELALLADRFGYPADAEQLAQKLPEGDAVRAFVTGDDARLSRAPSSLARFLEVVRLVRRGDPDGAALLASRALPSHALDSSVLSLRLCAGDEKVAPALFARVLVDASLDAGATVATKAKADLDALRTLDTTRVTAAVYGWLGIQRVDGWTRFEVEVERAGAHDRGPFFDRATRKVMLRARAADALRHIGLRIARESEPDAAATAFADEVPKTATSELGAALRAWHHALVDARRGFVTTPPTNALGPLATVDVIETAVAGLGTEVPDDEWDARAAARWALGRLDARRAHRVMALRLGEHVMFDPELVRAARAGAANAPPWPRLGLDRAAETLDEAPQAAASAVAKLGAVRPRVAARFGAALAPKVRTAEKASALGAALVAAGVSPALRRAVALGALAHDGAPLAATLLSALAGESKGPLARLDLVEDAARATAAAYGEEAAARFRAEHPIGDASSFAAPILYAHGRPLAASGGPREALDLARLLSVAASLHDPAELAAARAGLEGAPTTRFAAIARHLVGLDDLATVLARPRSPSERCELAYYLALAAHAAGRAEDADVWLQTALDEGTSTIAEWRWAALMARAHS